MYHVSSLAQILYMYYQHVLYNRDVTKCWSQFSRAQLYPRPTPTPPRGNIRLWCLSYSGLSYNTTHVDTLFVIFSHVNVLMLLFFAKSNTSIRVFIYLLSGHLTCWCLKYIAAMTKSLKLRTLYSKQRSTWLSWGRASMMWRHHLRQLYFSICIHAPVVSSP